jgi:Mg2+ and Co2+ transporter CorA
LVFASFDLLDSRLGQTTNELVKALTFYTVLIGLIAAVAGLFGMNFDPPFFRSGATGFFAVLGGVALVAAFALVWARSREWL